MEIIRKKNHILLADDEDGLLESMCFILQSHGFDVEIADNGLEVLAKIFESFKSDYPFDLLITDINMPAITGTQLMKNIAEIGLQINTIVITAYEKKVEELRSNSGLQVKDVLIKPFTENQILTSINKVLIP